MGSSQMVGTKGNYLKKGYQSAGRVTPVVNMWIGASQADKR